MKSSFIFNQTSNIFLSKILHISFLAFELLCHQAFYYYHPHLPRTNLNIILYTSALAFSRKKVLRVLQSQGQAACLMAGLQKKTTYRLAPFLTSGNRARDALQKKANRGVISKVVRETAS